MCRCSSTARSGVTCRCLSGSSRRRSRSSVDRARSVASTWARPLGYELFHRNALGEVARLVHVEAAVLGDPVGEELQRHAEDEGTQDLRCLGDGEHDAGHPVGSLVVLAGYRYNVRPPGDGFLDVGERLLPYQALAEDSHDRAVLVHEGYGAVFHLAGRVALGGEVGDLLELQCSFERHRVRRATPEEERAPRLLEDAGGLLYPTLHKPKRFLHFLRRPAQVAPEFQELLLRHCFFRPRQFQGEQIQGGDLGEEGLGGGHTYLRPCPGEQDRFGLPRYKRALCVGDREHASTEIPRRLHRRQGVGRLPALGDVDEQRPLISYGLGVAVLARHGDLHGDTGEAFDGVLAEQARVVGRAAGDDREPLHVREVELYLREVHGAIGVEASGEGIPQGGGLLVDLLEHVVLKYAELDGFGVPVDLEGRPSNRFSFERENSYGGACNLHDLTVQHDQKLAGLLEQGLDRAREEVLAYPQAHDERALVPGCHHGPRLARAYCRYRERAPEALQGPGERLAQRCALLHALGEQVRYDLRVRLGLEGAAAPLELLFELREVLDDAVVHPRHRPAVPELRVGVHLVGAPVRRPAGVPHPGPRPGEVAVAFGDGRGQPVQMPAFFDPLYPPGDRQPQPRRVVAPVLQVPQALHENLEAPLFANVTNYAAHGHTSLLDESRTGHAGRVRVEKELRALTAFCPRRRRRDLSPP